MPVIIILNESKTHYDAIRIMQDDKNLFHVGYAYRVENNNLNPNYSISQTFTKFEEVQHYLELLGALLQMDKHKPSTVDVQMDGFPCIVMNVADFIQSINSPMFLNGIRMSVRFQKLPN